MTAQNKSLLPTAYTASEVLVSDEATLAVSIETLTTFLDAMGMAQKLSEKEKQQFLQISQAYGLNPFKREIYVSKYGDNFSVIVGFEVYLKRAERTGKLDGWECTFEGSGDDLSCTVTIYRKDWARPFRHTAWYIECVQKTREGRPTQFWQKARLMTRKVAISQAFRLCFPDELGGMPYTGDELGVEDVTHEVVASGGSTETITPQVSSTEPRKPGKKAATEAMQAQFEAESKKDTYAAQIEKYAGDLGALNDLERAIGLEPFSLETKRHLIKGVFDGYLLHVKNADDANDVQAKAARWYKASVLLEEDLKGTVQSLVDIGIELGFARGENKKFAPAESLPA